MALALRPRMTPAAVPAFLDDAFACYRAPAQAAARPLRFGVDLGTATIVLTAVDAELRPVYWDFVRCAAVRDGVVVDFAGAVRAVCELRARAQSSSHAVDSAATAYPPTIAAAEARACRYVLEQSGISCRALIDEVSAAQALLGVSDGIIVDVGGGSTGVGVFADGELVQLSDAPGGGHHLDLIIAGALRIAVEDAEARKRETPAAVAQIVQPGIERIAESIKRQIGAAPRSTVHLVGGALMLPGAPETIARYLDARVVAYPHADLITPFGMACSDG